MDKDLKAVLAIIVGVGLLIFGMITYIYWLCGCEVF